jgi:hypothetical protein
VQVSEFPHSSVSVHITVVVPNGKTAGASFEYETEEQLSVAVGVPRTTPEAVHDPASVGTSTSAAQEVMSGGVVSRIVII